MVYIHTHLTQLQAGKLPPIPILSTGFKFLHLHFLGFVIFLFDRFIGGRGFSTLSRYNTKPSVSCAGFKLRQQLTSKRIQHDPTYKRCFLVNIEYMVKTFNDGTLRYKTHYVLHQEFFP